MFVISCSHPRNGSLGLSTAVSCSHLHGTSLGLSTVFWYHVRKGGQLFCAGTWISVMTSVYNNDDNQNISEVPTMRLNPLNTTDREKVDTHGTRSIHYIHTQKERRCTRKWTPPLYRQREQNRNKHGNRDLHYIQIERT